MSRTTWISGALALGVGLALAAPSAASAAPIDEIVTDPVPAGTARIVLDLEGAPVTPDVAVRWQGDDEFAAVSLAPTVFGAAADLTSIESADLGVRVRTDAPSVSYAVTFVDGEGAVIGERRYELPTNDDDGGGDGTDGAPADGPAPADAGAADLAATGTELPLGWIVLGVVAVGAGAALLVVRSRRAGLGKESA